jgi:hypothetical protein
MCSDQWRSLTRSTTIEARVPAHMHSQGDEHIAGYELPPCSVEERCHPASGAVDGRHGCSGQRPSQEEEAILDDALSTWSWKGAAVMVAGDRSH